MPRLLRACRIGCCRTTLVCGAAGMSSCGSSLLLLNRRSMLEPFAAPSAPEPLALAFVRGACAVADPDALLLAAAELAGRAGRAAALVLEVPFLAAAELPDAA